MTATTDTSSDLVDQASHPSVLENSHTPEPHRRHSRVLHVINGEHFSGAERVQDLLATGLPEFGYDVEFACLKDGSFKQCRTSDTPIHTLEMKSRFDLSVVKRLASIADNNGCQIVHAHTPRSAMVGSRVAKRCGLPFVYHVHSPTSRDSTRRITNWINQRVERNAIRSAKALITVSGSLQNHVVGMGVDEAKVHVVRNGVAMRNMIAREAPTDAWTVGTLALFRPRKGTEVLLESLAKLRSADVPVKLLAVGGFETPEYESFIRSTADRLGISDAVEWTGFCRDVDAQLARMDVMVLPSLFGEGLPMVVLEAMATGVPVIATDVEGVPEAIRDNEDGLLAKAGDSEDLARRIEELFAGVHDWQQLRESGYQRQRESFSTASMSRGVADVYDRL